ncbi:ATP-dependent nuclease [Komagataeibacter europaeus]|uniref:ATP-dependent nuclease n=1 Tax=Komagataeibacter europaeus TaxID=33995 RepID=UPI0009DA0C7A|nr:AAA family ATPase [Komagataeibacter europaeus]
MFTSGNTSPCHHSLHLFVKTDESQQAGIVQKLSDQALKKFLPGIKSVTFSVSDERRYSALRQAIEIEVNDGVVTNLEAKGDGVQSLVALGLRRHLLEENREKLTYIFAVEEPEAHLHADAIHELKKVLNELSDVDQLVITTHSGILEHNLI